MGVAERRMFIILRLRLTLGLFAISIMCFCLISDNRLTTSLISGRVKAVDSFSDSD
jgi:hypothetical protein